MHDWILDLHVVVDLIELLSFWIIHELWQQNVLCYVGTDKTVKTQGQPQSRQMDYNTKNVKHITKVLDNTGFGQ